ncbi:arginase family protein [Actinocrispum wychmicini]|uniref:Arginase n=1 Tax=Actinocrispum wychmicini TaxID=1213861 RepID=A0A4R2JKU6_9PSEU|nr:arginase family protein [Actinocrispum wychmicini]TCO57209.1 arginase [Actinocrispum wychmicini]
MAIISVPFHQDEQLREGTIPLSSEATLITPELPGTSLWDRLATLYSAVASAVSTEIEASATATVVSGDCMVALGVVAGVQRAGTDPSIIWFDAHGDVHTMASSTSGYIGGMALRMVLGGDYSLVGERIGLRPLAESRAVLVDARDLDPAEADYLAAAEITRCPVDDVRIPDGPLVLHVDIDVIDAGDVPGLLFPVSNGPSTSSVLDAIRRIIATGNVVALDLAFTWHSAPEHHDLHADLVRTLVGWGASQANSASSGNSET